MGNFWRDSRLFSKASTPLSGPAMPTLAAFWFGDLFWVLVVVVLVLIVNVSWYLIVFRFPFPEWLVGEPLFANVLVIFRHFLEMSTWALCSINCWTVNGFIYYGHLFLFQIYDLQIFSPIALCFLDDVLQSTNCLRSSPSFLPSFLPSNICSFVFTVISKKGFLSPMVSVFATVVFSKSLKHQL